MRAHSFLGALLCSLWRKRRVISWSWGLWLLTGLCLDEFLRANPQPEVLKHALSKMRSSIPPQTRSGSGYKGQKSIFFLFSENFNCIVLAVEEIRCCGKTWFCMDWGGGLGTPPSSPWTLQFPIHSHTGALKCSAPAEA